MITTRTGSSVAEQLTADQRVTGSIPVQSFFYFSLNFNYISCNLANSETPDRNLTFLETANYQIWKLNLKSYS